MTIDQLRRMHGARPFSSFDFHLADGRSLPVTHPESLAVFPSGRTLVVTLPNDSFEVIDLLSVTRLRLPATGAGRRNGRRR